MLMLNLSISSWQQRAGPAAHQELVSAALDHGIAQKCDGDLQHTRRSPDAIGALVIVAIDETAQPKPTPRTALTLVGSQYDAP